MELFSLFNLLDVLGMIFKIEEFSINKFATDPIESFTLCTRNWEERGRMNLLHSIYEMNGNKDSNILTETSHGVAQVIIAANSSQIFKIFANAKRIHNPKTYAEKMQVQPFVFILWPDCLNAENNKHGNPMEKILTEFVNRLKTFEPFELLTLDSECYIVFLLEQDNINTFRIYELYRKGNEYVYKKFTYKSFLETDNTISMSFDGLVKRRSSMQGISLNVVGVENSEYEADTSFSVSKNGSVKFKDGFSVQLLTELELYYNFTVNAIKEDTWIDVVNERLVGMAKRIHNGDADLAISITGLLPYSAKTFTFLVPSYSMSISAFFRRSSNYQVRDIYFQPFSSVLWLALICMWILLPLIVVPIVYLKTTLDGTRQIREVEQVIIPMSFQSDDMVSGNDYQFSEECFIWIFATICQQGWYYHPNSNSLRVIFAIALYSALVVYYSYSAMLVSTFALEIETIQSVEDLLRSSYILGIKDEIDLKSWFQENMEDDEEKKSLLLGSKVSRKLSPIINERYILEISEAVQIVNKKHYSFVSYPDPFYIYIRKFYSDNHICKTYREIPLVKESFRTGMFVAKNSSYKEHFNYLLTALLENGMTQRNLNYYTLNYKTQCKGQMNNRSNKALHFNEVFTAIMFITFGILLSVAILVAEQAINARIQRNANSCNRIHSIFRQ